MGFGRLIKVGSWRGDPEAAIYVVAEADPTNGRNENGLETHGDLQFEFSAKNQSPWRDRALGLQCHVGRSPYEAIVALRGSQDHPKFLGGPTGPMVPLLDGIYARPWSVSRRALRLAVPDVKATPARACTRQRRRPVGAGPAQECRGAHSLCRWELHLPHHAVGRGRWRHRCSSSGSSTDTGRSALTAGTSRQSGPRHDQED